MAAFSFLAAGGVLATEQPVPDPIVMREGLLVRPDGRGERSALPRDAVAAQLVTGRWKAPQAGDTFTLRDGTTTKWEQVTANTEGWIVHPALRGGGYVSWTVEADARRVLVLEAAGHGMLYVNGEPRPGDPYDHGYLHLPVELRPGKNEFLIQGVRNGRIRARLVPPRAPVFLDKSDTTLPDLIAGEDAPVWGAVVVQNATAQPLGNLVLRTTASGTPAHATPVPSLLPLCVRKVAFQLNGQPPSKADQCDIELSLIQKKGDTEHTLDTIKVGLRVRQPGQGHRRTFQSGIDGSVQYYAVQPARPWTGALPRKPALFLSLHGAGVEAQGQADSYASKPWGHLVAPTNRRPFGFDWEDWGRLDALEVLNHAQQHLHTDPQRTYLTGHSMGGHGAWQVGATFPDRFAAIGPSAGWISFWSYGGARKADNPDPLQELLQRATTPSDTLALARNYLQHGVYILHGEKDDNVPVTQARRMAEHLRGFHRDFVLHEQPGAGHWWDDSDEPGVGCVDWAPMFDFFARHVIPARESLRELEFTTACPGVSAWCHWVGIAAQQQHLKPSRVKIRHDAGLRRFVGTTENVARLVLDLAHVEPGKPLQVELDGQKLAEAAWPAPTRRLWLEHSGPTWSVCAAPSLTEKGPHRYGPFKDAFRNRMLFVYGTHGSALENGWAFAKARFDAETFWYRGNGSIDVLTDDAFLAGSLADRNVILYGNADTNTAWKALLAESPAQVRRGSVRVGEREEKGDDLACLFVQPRRGSDTAAVGVVAGTGLIGMRQTDRLPYFQSGTGYPDCLVLGAGGGVRVVGFFGLDWKVESGEFAWAE